MTERELTKIWAKVTDKIGNSKQTDLVFGSMSNGVFVDLNGNEAARSVTMLYIDRSTGIIYRWDENSFVQVGGKEVLIVSFTQNVPGYIASVSHVTVKTAVSMGRLVLGVFVGGKYDGICVPYVGPEVDPNYDTEWLGVFYGCVYNGSLINVRQRGVYLMMTTPSIMTMQSEISSKQNALVSGENIKTINGQSVLGSGDVTIAGKSAYQSYVDTTTDNPPKTEAEWVASLKGEDGVSLGEVAIADNLTTDDGTKVLSAKQGYLLGQKVNNADDEPTAGSDNLVKSGGIVSWGEENYGKYIENPEFVYVKTDKDDKILWAIKADGGIYYGAGVPQQVKDYIEEKISSLSLDEYEDIVTFLGSLIEGDTLTTLLNAKANVIDVNTVLTTKVDKETGKSLIDAKYAEGVYHIENPEWVYVLLDAEERILAGLKSDGSVEWSIGVPTPVKTYIANAVAEIKNGTEGTDLDGLNKIIAFLNDFTTSDTLKNLLDEKLEKTVVYNDKFIKTTTDNNNKVIVAIDKNGRIHYFVGVANPSFEQNIVDRYDYLCVKTDSNNNIIEAITLDGKKLIGAFADETLKDIAALAQNGYSMMSVNSFNTKVRTSETAGGYTSHTLELPLSDNEFNIRFKFRISENLLNANKSALIAKFGTISLYARPISLSQYTSSYTYNNESKTSYWPCVIGGLSYGKSKDNIVSWGDNNLGPNAFLIQYVGTSTNVSVSNDGTKFTLSVDGVDTDFSYSTYQTVNDLIVALNAVADLTVTHALTEGRNCDELAVFAPIKLGSYFLDSSDAENPTEYFDKAPCVIPYAVDDSWHQVEIVKNNGTVYLAVDGRIQSGMNIDNKLQLGGECNVSFKDIVICTNNPSDAEIVNGNIISSVNPYFIIFEGHGIDDVLSSGIHTDNMAVSTDRLFAVFSILKKNGYVPVSIEDIADFYKSTKELPKRCYTLIFDDFRYSNCLDIHKRRPFITYNVKPALAIVSDNTKNIEINGTSLSKQEAAVICKNNSFSLVSHTRNHRSVIDSEPSQYIDETISDMYSADINSINGKIIVFPRGRVNRYECSMLDWLGLDLGINVAQSYSSIEERNLKCRNRYNLIRVEIGKRASFTYIVNNIL